MELNNSVNNNIDIYLNFYYVDKELYISILITENNQVINVGTYSKDTRTNLERFVKLYSELTNPYIISKDIEKNLSLIIKEMKVNDIEDTKLLFDYFNKEHMFIDLGKNIFVDTSEDEDEDEYEEETLISLYLEYLYFFHKVKGEGSTVYDEYSEEDSNQEYNKSLKGFYFTFVERFQKKVYFDRVIEKINYDEV